METLYNQITEYITEQRENMILLLEKIVNIESGPAQPEGVDETIKIFEEEFNRLNLETKIVECENAGNIIISEHTPDDVENERPIVLSGHMDTVFQPGILKEHAYKVMDDHLAKGAGIADMKGGLVIALYTLKALIHIGYRKHPIKMLFIGDEETLHRYSDTKEIMVKELTGAAMMLNFEPAKSPNEITVSRKGGGMVSLEVQGVGAHSGSGATVGRSAILELSHKIIELEAKTDIQRGKLINCGLVEGGVSANTIPGYAKANFSVRFSDLETKKEIIRDFEEAINHSIVENTTAQFEVEGLLDAMEFSPAVDQLAEHFIKTGISCGYGKLTKNKSEGASDASLGVIAGVPTLCSMGIIGEGTHTTDEIADIDSLVSRSILAAAGISSF